jgi:hypothetical protein
MLRRALLSVIIPLILGAETPASLAELHTQARSQPIADRIETLYDLAVAASAVDRQTSASWALEMFDLSNTLPRDSRFQQMLQAAQRKNALTVLSLTDPLAAAQHFFELEPSAAHLPNEDPRIDLARHLFPKLWAKQGAQSLPAIRRMCDFTSEQGQYPYVAMGHVLPLIAKADPEAAHILFNEALKRLDTEHGIVRTQTDYLKFLREIWPAISIAERRAALEAALAAIPHPTNNFHWYIEYYTQSATVRFESERDARVYDLLPFIHALDEPSWEDKLRQQYPALSHVPIAPLDAPPWRAGAVATTPDRDKPELMKAALENSYLFSLPKWVAENPRRAASIALGIKDTARRHNALAILIPAYIEVDRAKAESWRAELSEAFGNAPETFEQLAFLVAFVRAGLALGDHVEAERASSTAIALGRRLLATRDAATPISSDESFRALRDLAMACGEFRFAGAEDFLRKQCGEDANLRTSMLAALARGALRNAPNYEEPS